MQSNFSEYIGVFLQEAQEQLEVLETSIVAIEKSSDVDGLLQVLFRAAHTLKGSSKAMGFGGIGDVTHEMEEVLDALRNHTLTLSSEIVDVLLACVDILTIQIQEVIDTGKSRNTDDPEIQDLVGRLRTFKPASSETAPQAAAKPAKPAKASKQPKSPKLEVVQGDRPASAKGMDLRITLADGCIMKGIRAVLIVQTLEGMGSVLECHPNAKELEDENFENTFDVVLDTDLSPSEAEARVLAMPEVVGVKIRIPEPEPLEVVETKPVAEAVATAPAGQANNAPAQTIRVDVARLDNLLNLVGELVTDRARLTTVASYLSSAYPDIPEIKQLLDTIGRIARITTGLQEEIMKSRMLPINGVFQRMPRLVRDLAKKCGKEVEFEVIGGETELDRSVLEMLGDPLIHLLRNSLDHGIEEPEDRLKVGKPRHGTLTLSARHEQGHILVEILDDGRGIDPAKIRSVAVKKGVLTAAAAESISDREAVELIFAPGFSTAAVTTDVSGRGVGMDIARANIEKIGGHITVESSLGRGCQFNIYLPLTLAIVRALLVSAAGVTFAVPVMAVNEMVDLDADNSDLTRCTVNGNPALLLRGETLPIANLARLMYREPKKVGVEDHAYRHAVILRSGKTVTALCVDELQGEQEIVVKPLGAYLRDIPGISGASILGDGRVALIVDPTKAIEEILRSAA